MELLKYIAAFAALAVVGRAGAEPAPAPADLVALASRAGIVRPLAVWCRGTFTSAKRSAYAVATLSSTGGGKYLVLGLNEKAIELASFAGGVDLACYSRDEAKELSKSLAADTVVHGSVSPIWNSTVICGFVDATNAVCWQYSPKERAFVKVGEWVT